MEPIKIIMKAVNLTEEYPPNCGVCIETILVRNIGKSQEVKLHQSSASSGIDRKQDGPGDQAPDKADYNADLEISKKKKAIERVVIEDIAIRYVKESSQPIQKSIGEVRGAFSVFRLESRYLTRLPW